MNGQILVKPYTRRFASLVKSEFLAVSTNKLAHEVKSKT